LQPCYPQFPSQHGTPGTSSSDWSGKKKKKEEDEKGKSVSQERDRKCT